jgi:branched-chain amino acid transport system permease protein
MHVGICLAACTVVGALTGIVSLRTSGIGFIMITLAFAQMGYFLCVSLKTFGGDDGMSIAQTSAFGPVNLGTPNTNYAFALACSCSRRGGWRDRAPPRSAWRCAAPARTHGASTRSGCRRCAISSPPT